MLSMVKQIMKYWVTDSDNITHSFARAQAVFNIPTYWVACASAVALGKWAFDPVSLAAGLSAVMLASGGWVWMDKKADK